MSMIKNQISALRELAELQNISYHKSIINRAANTIEALSAKLETANKELERWHTDKINDKIKNPFARTSALCCHNCDHKDEYIEEPEAADMERAAEECGRWIPYGVDHMPHRGSTVLIRLRNVHDGITGDDDYTYDISF